MSLSDDDLDRIEAHQHDPLAARIQAGTVLALVAEVRRLREELDAADRHGERLLVHVAAVANERDRYADAIREHRESAACWDDCDCGGAEMEPRDERLYRVLDEETDDE